MGIQLRTPTPKKLYFRDGHWALEVERYLPVEPRVFRPMTEKIVGEARIARLLRTGTDSAFIEATMALIHAGEAGAWEVVDGDWLRCPLDD